MKEKIKNRKDWIKNILIIFLVIMLILTFFSNTIMNYSLAEVSVNYISSGQISTAISGTGVVTGVDPYNVVATSGRKIKSVNVRKGDTVSKGDVLYVFEEGDSTEVADLLKQYNELRFEYQSYIIDNKIPSEVVKAAEEKDTDFLNANMAALESMLPTLEEKQNRLDSINEQISLLGVTLVDTSAEEAELKLVKAALEKSQTSYTEALQKYNGYVAELETVIANFQMLTPEEQEARNAEVIAKITELAANRDAAKSDVDKYKAEVETYTARVESLTETIQEKTGAPDSRIAELTYEKTVADFDLAEYTDKYNKTYSAVKEQLNLEAKLDALDAAYAAYEKLAAKGSADEVTAPVSGVVTSVNCVAGETVSKDDVLAVIQLSGKEYVLEMTVTKEQAARVKVGDYGTVTSSWYYQDISLVVTQIKNDVNNPKSGNRIIVFNVSGSDVLPGQTLNVSVGERTASYDMVVPNNAIREDSNGTYILIVVAKSTPLGNRYTATRVDVTKLASDNTNTAISAGIDGWESVITTSTKPVSAGDLVRISGK